MVSLAMAMASSSFVGRDDAQHRPEDLLLGDGRGVVDVAEDGRLDEPAPVEVLAAGRRRWPASRPRPSPWRCSPRPGRAAARRREGPSGSRRRTGRRPAPGRRCRPGPRPARRGGAGDHDPGQRRADLAGQEALGAGQAWPAAVARSMSSRMTAADLPPSSRVQRAIRSPQIEAMRRPAAVEPVKVILSTGGRGPAARRPRGRRSPR